MTFATLFGKFVIFLILTFVTLGIYPLYFWVSRTEKQIDLLARIEANTRKA